MTKAKVLEAITSMPDEFPLEAFFEHLLFIQKVERGLLQSKEGLVITHEEAKQKFKKWLP